MAQDNRDNRKDETEKLRAEATALLEQARKQLADIQKALSSLGGDRAAHARLSAAMCSTGMCSIPTSTTPRAEDEAESRKRQAADKKYIADQLARHTPEGDLNASGGMIDSMLDLHAHGAGASPQFMPRYNAIVNKAETQRNAMKAAGQSRAEFDHNMNASVRRFLEKEKGLSETASSKRLGSFANPLDAAKSLLNGDTKNGEVNQSKPSAQIHASLHLDDIRAKMKAAGVTLAASGADNPSHGVNVQKAATKDAAVLGT